MTASGNMKARWNQHKLQGACPRTSPIKRTASDAVRATSHAANRRATGPVSFRAASGPAVMCLSFFADPIQLLPGPGHIRKCGQTHLADQTEGKTTCDP